MSSDGFYVYPIKLILITKKLLNKIVTENGHALYQNKRASDSDNWQQPKKAAQLCSWVLN